MKAADLVLVDIEEMPRTHDELKDWVITNHGKRLLVSQM